MTKNKYFYFTIVPIFLILSVVFYSFKDKGNFESAPPITSSSNHLLKGFDRYPCSETTAPITFGTNFKRQCVDNYIVLGNSKKGPFGYFHSVSDPEKRKIEEIEEIIIIEQNFENLGAMEEVIKDSSGNTTKVIVDKSPEKKQQLANRILAQTPDIIVGIEVKDIQTAQDFVKNYLNDLYQPLLIEGNDERGIDVSFFIKKDLPLDIEIQSHKNISSSYKDESSLSDAPNEPTIFSRDLPFLSLRPAGSNPRSKPLITIVAAHYKAQMPTPEGDKRAYERRSKQVIVTTKLINEFFNKNPTVPFLITGDFNNDIRPYEKQPTYPPPTKQEKTYVFEFTPFYKDLGLVDAFELNSPENAIPKDRRGTHYYFEKIEFPDGTYSNEPVLSQEQLDGLLVNNNLKKYVVSSSIFTDLDSNGKPLPLPTKPEEVEKRSSDHDGSKLVIKFKKMLNDYQKIKD